MISSPIARRGLFGATGSYRFFFFLFINVSSRVLRLVGPDVANTKSLKNIKTRTFYYTRRRVMYSKGTLITAKTVASLVRVHTRRAHRRRPVSVSCADRSPTAVPPR